MTVPTGGYAPVDHPGVVVPEHLRPWSVPYPDYRPVDITPPELRPEEGMAGVADGWAEPHPDPADLPDRADRAAAALIGYDHDAAGRPLNPTGRTGRTGRNLGRWGENSAADAIVIAGDGADRLVLLIRRGDCGQWAIPGGHFDPGETPNAALLRELREEAGLDLSHLGPEIVSRGVVDDPRATDHAWIATVAAVLRIRVPLIARAGDDATAAAWWPFTDLAGLDTAVESTGGQRYTAHRPLLATALDHLAAPAKRGGAMTDIAPNPRENQ